MRSRRHESEGRWIQKADSAGRELEAQGGFFNKFEMAQIMYLRPTSIDVAVALIPR